MVVLGRGGGGVMSEVPLWRTSRLELFRADVRLEVQLDITRGDQSRCFATLNPQP